MRRRDFLTGAAAIAAYSRLDPAEALTKAQRIALLGSVSASSLAPYPAPPGFHWEFVIDDANANQRVKDDANANQSTIDLVIS